MKRWAVLTVFVYALALLVLTLPVALVAFGNWGVNHDNVKFGEALGWYVAPIFWIWLAILLAGQSLLLLLPLRITERRLPARRPLRTPVLVTGFFLGLLCLAGLLSLLCAIFKEGGFEALDVTGGLTSLAYTVNHVPPPQSGDFNWQNAFGLAVPVLVFWLIWAVIFRRATWQDDPDALLKRATHWLLRGSILELIIAVPSHVIVRRRDDCCAPAGTFWGIATGISVMLLCFGPGVFFLFVERMQKLKPREKAPAER
jgi:hypothetical protein